jgi:hypothetical protein
MARGQLRKILEFQTTVIVVVQALRGKRRCMVAKQQRKKQEARHFQKAGLPNGCGGNTCGTAHPPAIRRPELATPESEGVTCGYR